MINMPYVYYHIIYNAFKKLYVLSYKTDHNII